MPTAKKYQLKDSGERKTFSTGMVRDSHAKTEFDRVYDGPMLDRWAELLTVAAREKYPDLENGKPNWMLAETEEELIRFKKSAARHFRQWIRGDVDEDHAAAVIFNLNGAEYVRDRLAQKALDS